MSTPGNLRECAAHYEVLGLIGQGGMGSVYKARDRRLDRLVALKFLSASLLHSSDARELFHREAQAIAALNHPNIGVLYDVGEADDAPYLVLEYLGGGSLEHRGANRQLPFPELLDYALQLASGLSHAHGHGIIHRDVKPANALFAETGILKLVDFGLAQWRGLSASDTSQSPCGTPHYMAPELLAGRGVDQRCDVFAFGVLLYRLAAGRLPFDGHKLDEVVKRISKERPTPLYEIRPDLPTAYIEVVEECLRKDASNRPGSMALIRHELEMMETAGRAPAREVWNGPTGPADLPTTSLPPPDLPARPSRKIHRRIAVGVSIAGLALAGLFLFQNSRTGLVSPHVEKLVVVLPFECRTSDSSASGFCKGLHADLLPRLNQTRQFQSSFWTVSAAEIASMGIRSAKDAGERLHANLAIQGAVSFTGGEYHVSLDLTDAQNARLLRSRSVSSRDTLALPGVLLSAALDLLETRIAANSTFTLSAAPSDVPESYQLSVQAQGVLLDYEGLESIHRAIAMLDRAISLDPNNALAHALRSDAYSQEFTQARDPASLKRAAEAAQTAYRLKPEDPRVLIAYGRSLRSRGDFSASIDAFAKASRINASDPEPVRLLALAYTDYGNDQKAVEAYRHAMELNPRWWPPWHNRAVYWARKGNTKQAISDLETARGLAPGNADILRDLGIYYERDGRISDAEQCLRQSLEIRQTHRAYIALAYIRERQDRPAEAAQLLQQAARLSPKDYLIYYNLAFNLSVLPTRKDDADKACSQSIELVTSYLREASKDAEAWARLAVCQARLGRSAEAHSALRTARQLQPDSISILKKAALIAAIEGNDDEAVGLLVRSIRAGENASEILRDPAFKRLVSDPAIRQRIVTSQKSGK